MCLIIYHVLKRFIESLLVIWTAEKKTGHQPKMKEGLYRQCLLPIPFMLLK